MLLVVAWVKDLPLWRCLQVFTWLLWFPNRRLARPGCVDKGLLQESIFVITFMHIMICDLHFSVIYRLPPLPPTSGTWGMDAAWMPGSTHVCQMSYLAFPCRRERQFEGQGGWGKRGSLVCRGCLQLKEICISFSRWMNETSDSFKMVE